MIVHSEVESDLIYSDISGVLNSEVIQDTIYSEELEYTDFDYLIRITQQNEPRETQDDKLRILQ